MKFASSALAFAAALLAGCSALTGTWIETEQAILAGSVAPDMQATSGSQKLEQVDAGDVTFNHEWN